MAGTKTTDRTIRNRCLLIFFGVFFGLGALLLWLEDYALRSVTP